MAEDFPVVGLDDDARQAVELLASRRLPGLIVAQADGSPCCVLPASQVVRFLVPSREIPVVNHDDTILEIAAVMARLRSPLVVVVRDRHILGAVTASRLLELAVTSH